MFPRVLIVNSKVNFLKESPFSISFADAINILLLIFSTPVRKANKIGNRYLLNVT